MTTDQATLTERRIKLRDQLLRTGPEHMNMAAWFKQDDFEVSLDNACIIDIEACGTTGCLAGHGAIIMAEQGVMVPCFGQDKIIDYFGLTNWAFYRESWQSVAVGDFNMAAEYDRIAAADGRDGRFTATRQAREWETLISYLDVLIKGET